MRDKLVMAEADTVELRCSDCIAMGVECPSGYKVDRMVCDVCGFRLALTYTACTDVECACPECGGSLDDLDDE